MELEYYKVWFEYRREPRSPLTKEEAAKAHEKKTPYVVVVKDDGKMKWVVSVNFQSYYCDVLYLDKNAEKIESEGYIQTGDQLFLRDRRIRDSKNLIAYLFETDGKVRRSVFGEDDQLLEVTYDELDVSSHYRDMIQFGNYTSILPLEKKA
ncbi:hypothetical protein [Laceyella putida]|uniref:YopX protein domain-containing protein n=1 Tax=Laceyella putida TaxID=110101 RepID=A0ABW2RQH2_9BACL